VAGVAASGATPVAKPIGVRSAARPFAARGITMLSISNVVREKDVATVYGMEVRGKHLDLPIGSLTVYLSTAAARWRFRPGHISGRDYAYRVWNVVLDETNVGTRMERAQMLAALRTFGTPLPVH